VIPAPLNMVRKFPGEILIFVVRIYQVTLSPFLGTQCRFVPTCSSYFVEAVRSHGALRGGLMGLWRILRCNPLSSGGLDPVKSSPVGPPDD
jgi:putative membrane protein insertion efficiency factor